jgi:EpsI family protein
MPRRTKPVTAPATSHTASRPAWLAAGIGLGTLLISGVGYRALAAHLERGPDAPAIAPGTLSRLPLQIGDWEGVEAPIDESIVRAADVDDYVNRRYTLRSNKHNVGLWVAFGVRARDLVPHRPEVCYPGAGWTLRDAETVVLQPDAAAAPLRARILSFQPGGMDQRPQVVLNYYIVDGETCEDVSLLRSKAWRGQASIGYMAQVQITCRTNPARPTDAPADAVRRFAVESFAPLRAMLHEVTAPSVIERQPP